MSIETLNRIVEETTVFYKTRDERDRASRPGKRGKISNPNHWTKEEDELLSTLLDYPARLIEFRFDRTFFAIRERQRHLRKKLGLPNVAGKFRQA